MRYAADLHLLLSAYRAARLRLHVHDYRSQPVLRAVSDARGPVHSPGKRGDCQLHERPGRYGKKPDPSRARIDQPHHLSTRDLLRSARCKYTLGATEGLERQADLEDGAERLGEPLRAESR